MREAKGNEWSELCRCNPWGHAMSISFLTATQESDVICYAISCHGSSYRHHYTWYMRVF